MADMDEPDMDEQTQADLDEFIKCLISKKEKDDFKLSCMADEPKIIIQIPHNFNNKIFTQHNHHLFGYFPGDNVPIRAQIFKQINEKFKLSSDQIQKISRYQSRTDFLEISIDMV